MCSHGEEKRMRKATAGFGEKKRERKKIGPFVRWQVGLFLATAKRHKRYNVINLYKVCWELIFFIRLY